ncbi:MAG: ABC transporter ATP-binding protein [Candidatus Omnitrophica bacterium]|nr:ABC transporter ATP-binding protein [Candidatus Omnitrophota bacterium]
MIEINSLRVDYDDVTAVCDLTLTIPTGQIYGLVGPNGAGKTSTLKALAGIIQPTYGEIKLEGIDLELHPRDALVKIGFMSDFPSVYENLKLWEYLNVFATAYGIAQKKRIESVRYWVKELDLFDKWDTFISDLSRGMRQRLALAKTLLHDPAILLLDEPASGLDPMGRIEMRKILKKVSLSGKTIVISSHILTELSDFCNAVGIMEKGKMVVSGTIDEIRKVIGAKSELIIIFNELSEQDRGNFKEILSRSPQVLNAKEEPVLEFRMSFSGDNQQASQLLSLLVSAGLSVCQFFIRQANVEDIFLKIGARQVS